MDQPIIRISGLHKRFGDNHVLRGIDFDVQAGDRVAILGSSGSGKSTLLRCLNFMETPSEGQIALKGKTIGRPTDRGMRYTQNELAAVRPVSYTHLTLPTKA